MNEIRPTHTIGTYVPMVDGPDKVSGRAKYTADIATRSAARSPGASSAAPMRMQRFVESTSPRR